MTQRNVPQGRFSLVLSVLPRGMEKPVTVTEISQITGIKTRDVYSILRGLLMQYDVPIGGSRTEHRNGVFIATTEEERAAALAPLTKNAREITRRADKLRRMEI